MMQAARGPTMIRSSPSACQLTGFEPATGSGRTKRQAEQAAASAILAREGVWKQEGSE